MAEKDKVYDPDIGLEGGGQSDSELMVNTCNYNEETEDKLNNTNYKLYPSSMPAVTLSAILVHNDTNGSSSSLGRLGGPQMDNPTGSGASTGQSRPINVCCNCGEETMEWLEGSRFECHRRYTREQDQEQLDAHNQLCRECATDEDRCDMCPIHPNSYYSEYVDTNTVPRVVRRFDNSVAENNH